MYQPKTVLGLPMSSFKLLSCAAGQDESVYATYGKAYTPISNLGKLPRFLHRRGLPDICNNPGTAWQVGVWNVGIPKGSVKVRVSVYCSPAVLKYCTTASGVKSGYVLQWAQPYQFGTSPRKQTEMFIDTSRLTLPQALHVVAGIRALGVTKATDLQSLGEPRATAKCSGGSYREATPTSPMTTISGQKVDVRVLFDRHQLRHVLHLAAELLVLEAEGHGGARPGKLWPTQGAVPLRGGPHQVPGRGQDRLAARSYWQQLGPGACPGRRPTEHCPT